MESDAAPQPSTANAGRHHPAGCRRALPSHLPLSSPPSICNRASDLPIDASI
ncbi:hypothetical protein OsI_35983 [Oryza sativa Indica Group]|uniref:Uncharacterized protein n=1 Tax=Oryza sativa subsp. indica TaxID=39946 RepID=A2ZDW8_ORYSI|nr:hypothetical protein OsI_35983 [Oryza sativa Indica Group]